MAIQQQIAAVPSITSSTELADKTISYAKAETDYYHAFESGNAGMDRHRDWQETAIAESGPVRPSFSVAGRKAWHGADKATAALLNVIFDRFGPSVNTALAL